MLYLAFFGAIWLFLRIDLAFLLMTWQPWPQRRPYTICTSRSGNVRHRSGGALAGPRFFLGGSFRGLGAGVGEENAESCGVVRPLRIPLVIRPMIRTYVVVVKWTNEILCGGYKLGVSIWGTVRLHWMDGWALSRADAQAPWHGTLETVWLHCDETQQVGCLKNWKVVRWCRTQACSHCLQGVVDGGFDEAGMSTAAPDRSTVLCSWMHQD